MIHLKKSTLLVLVLPISLLLNACLFKKKNFNKQGIPRRIVVLPMANKSHDLSTPVLIRYFMEKRLKSKRFELVLSGNEVNKRLYTMGITNGNQVNAGNIQNIGQFLSADGILKSTILSLRQDINSGTKIIQAKFQLYAVQSGNILWNNEVEIEVKESSKIPLSGLLSTDWTSKELRKIAKGPAGKLPDKVAKQAIKTLRH